MLHTRIGRRRGMAVKHRIEGPYISGDELVEADDETSTIFDIDRITALCAAIAFRAGLAEPPAKGAGQDSLEMRYARLRLRMAEIGLEKAVA